jgi:hypothetical protein
VFKLFKLVLVLQLTLGAAAVPALAQSIGFKLGPTFSKFSVEDTSEGEPENLTSFGGGGFIRFGFAGLSLQAEVLALTKGASQTFSDATGTGTAKFKLNYVEVPVTIMFSLGSGPYLFAGPSVAFELSCKIDIESPDINLENEDCDDETTQDTRKKTDVSVLGGAGFEFPIGVGRLLIEGRYIYGLTNLNDDPSDPNNSIKHRTWAALAGFVVPIGRR